MLIKRDVISLSDRHAIYQIKIVTRRQFARETFVSGQVGSREDGSLRLTTCLEKIGRRVRLVRAAGKNAEDIIRNDEAGFVALHPDWLHPSLPDLQIRYSVA